MASFIAKDKTVPPLPATDDDDESVIGGEPTVDADEVITEEQMPCTVVITGLPKTNAEETTAALSEKFMGVGTVQHTIFQMDGDQQHAVVVLDTADAATAACAMSGSQILGCDVNIIRAQQLNDDSGKNGGGENSSKMFKQAKVATVGVTASALVLGGQAVDGIKSLDERAGISKTVGAAVTTTTAKVNELDQVSDIQKILAVDSRNVYVTTVDVPPCSMCADVLTRGIFVLSSSSYFSAPFLPLSLFLLPLLLCFLHVSFFFPLQNSHSGSPSQSRRRQPLSPRE